MRLTSYRRGAKTGRDGRNVVTINLHTHERTWMPYLTNPPPAKRRFIRRWGHHTHYTRLSIVMHEVDHSRRLLTGDECRIYRAYNGFAVESNA